MEANGQVMTSHLPPGFRFHPTDQELINCYLTQKLTASLPSYWNIVTDIDLYKFNPWELPGQAFFGEGEWFFFSPRERKYPNGVRPNRAAGIGYWKATGTDKPILGTGGTKCIGVKKALVFYKGRPPKGVKTEWVMHEYRLSDSIVHPPRSQKQKGSMRLDDWVLCRVRQKGNSPAASDEVAETSSPTESSFTVSAKSEDKQELQMNTTIFTDWNENQLLGHLFEPHEQERESIAEVLDPTFIMRNSQLGGGCDYFEAQQGSSPLIPSVLGSMKRKQSIDVLDELMPLQPWKRLQCSLDGLLSPAESVSISQCFPEFFL